MTLPSPNHRHHNSDQERLLQHHNLGPSHWDSRNRDRAWKCNGHSLFIISHLHPFIPARTLLPHQPKQRVALCLLYLHPQHSRLLQPPRHHLPRPLNQRRQHHRHPATRLQHHPRQLNGPLMGRLYPDRRDHRQRQSDSVL